MPRTQISTSWWVLLSLSLTAAACAEKSRPAINASDAASEGAINDAMTPIDMGMLDGAVISDGAIVMPDGAIVTMDGAIVMPDGSIIMMDGGIMPDGAVMTETGVMCMPGLSACGGVCVNAMTDRANCGSCGLTCVGAQICMSGVCREPACGIGLSMCDGRCANTSIDSTNCGICGNRCGASASCVSGACVTPPGPDAGADGAVMCPTSTRLCGVSCVDTMSNANHCGACGTVCMTGLVCTAGSCVMPVVVCPTGRTHCGGGFCADTASDPFHCGACGNRCTDVQMCASGRCVTASCSGGLTNCSGFCANTASDPFHCGACGNRCPTGQFCSGGRCGSVVVDAGMTDGGMGGIDVTCGAGLTNCSGGCVNTTSDPFRCGSCTNRCPDGQMCSAGRCGSMGDGGTGDGGTGGLDVTCGAGLTNCSGGCVNTTSDPFRCGSCTNRCPDGQMCAAGVCSGMGDGGTGDGGTGGMDVTCGAGLTNCSGGCVNTSSDPFRCGSCTNRCPDGQMCAAGVCIGMGDGGTGDGGMGDGGMGDGSATGCGAMGQSCCAGATPCRMSGTSCVSGVCTAPTCGRSGQPCCAGALACAPGLTCSSGTCR